MIEAKNVSMEYSLNTHTARTLKEVLFGRNMKEHKLDSIKALDNISFKVEKSEIFGIIGSNGAGKSTLLKILAGIIKPTSGSVSLDGKIAPMIELGTGFDYELSAIENIYLSGAILGFSKSYITDRIVDIFNFSELWEYKDVAVKYFSSGMVARLAFAVSTIVVPDILIVDEILSVGDLAFQQKSLKKMMTLMNSGATVIYVSHDIDSVQKLCNSVMWLDKGCCKMIDKSEIVCKQYKDEIFTSIV